MFSTTKTFQKNLLTPGIFLGVLFSQPISESIPVHTYSIVALYAETGELGVVLPNDPALIEAIIQIGSK